MGDILQENRPEAVHAVLNILEGLRLTKLQQAGFFGYALRNDEEFADVPRAMTRTTSKRLDKRMMLILNLRKMFDSFEPAEGYRCEDWLDVPNGAMEGRTPRSLLTSGDAKDIELLATGVYRIIG